MISRLAIALLVLIALIGAAATGYLINAGPVGGALLTKQLCSLVFVSELPPALARKTYIESLIGPADRLFTHHIDRARQAVHVRGIGHEHTARFYPGLGCVLGTERPPLLVETVTVRRPTVAGIDLTLRRRTFDEAALEAALDRAFEEPTGVEGRRNTLAVAVRYRDRIVAERYAPHVNAATPLPGWSMAKSVTATLAGMLVHEDRLDLTAGELYPSWAAPDPRAQITAEQLLRMTSGIDIEENGSGLDANSHMLFLEPSTIAFAVQRGLATPPGSAFAYSSGSTMLLQGVLTDRAGGREAIQGLVRTLFDTLGMHSAVLEPDPAGMFVGSSFLFASARDWTALGQLYLNGGVWNGTRLFDPGWSTYVSERTPQSGDRAYGAGFWRPQPAARYEGQGVPPLPPETYAAQGLQNQALFVLPAQELVIVRLGATASGAYWQSGQWDLVADVLAAMKPADETL
ncbi:MAG: serine hydrolase [Pseudomonadota bacterium]